jgi:hypothetical protein
MWSDVTPIIDEKKARRKRLNPAVARKAIAHYEEKYGKSPSLQILDRPKTKEQHEDEQGRQLQDLFDTIIDEIEER